MADAPKNEILEADRTIYAFRRNVFVAASAGTGKTHRLTSLYVLLALGLTSMGQRDDRSAAPAIGPERIVATTFSRAAAAEIAARVEDALRAIARWDGSSPLVFAEAILPRAEALGQRASADELRRRANDALARWGSARIDTLHGVARRVVQRHALAIGLPPAARVLDEEEAQALSDAAVDDALSDALAAGGERADAARALIVSAGGVWATRARLLRMLDRLDEEGLDPKDLALPEHVADAGVLARELLALARHLAGQASPAFREPAAGLARSLARASDGQLLPREAVPILTDLLTRRLAARAKRSPAEDELEEFSGRLPGKTKDERAAGLVALLEHAPRLGEREARLRDLLGDVRARLAAAKRRAGALGFGDLLRIARDTLRDDAEIAATVRGEIDALLVDEFQDTSRVQRDLVYLLRERDDAAAARAAGAAPAARGLAGHGLFVVGDRKQSIYGFRGADVSVFSRIAAELAGRAAATALALPDTADVADAPVADFVALRESRRSGPAILAFVNAFAARDFSPPGGGAAGVLRPFEIAYGPAEHLVPADGGPVGPGRVVFVADDGASPADAAPIVRESAGAAREAHVAAAYVARITHGEAPGVPYKDVAILARRRSTIPLVELALARLEIPYVVAGRALYDAPEVRDIAALLRLLLDPRDRLAAAVVLRGPMVALSDTSLALLSLPGRGLFVPLLGRWPAASAPRRGAREPQAVQPPGARVDPGALPGGERARLEAFRARFGDLRAAAMRLPPGEAIRAAIAAFDLDRVLAALPRAEARIGNLDRLVSIARRKSGTLAAFVAWLERRIRDDADEAEAAVFSQEDDAVRLTTIHASKGLDFPAVVLVDLNAEPRGDAGGVGFVTDGERATLTVRHYAPRGSGRALVALGTSAQKAAQADARAREQAEQRRLTYVAITRARHTLALVGSAAPPRPSAALHTLATGLAEPALADRLSVESATSILEAARPAPPRAAAPSAPPRAPTPPDRRAGPADITLDAAALALFGECPRRYRLRCLLGIPEPKAADQLDLFATPSREDTSAEPPPRADDPALDPRPLHRAAHRVLARWPDGLAGADAAEAEAARRLAAEGLPPGDAETRRLAAGIASFLGGSYLRGARDEGARVRWDVPFSASLATDGEPRIRVRGALDLLVVGAGGRVDVAMVSTARAAIEPALDSTARLAALAMAEPGTEVRAGIVSLGGADEPRWLSSDEPAAFERELAGTARRLVRARAVDRFDGIARRGCERLDCGFVDACHGEARAKGQR